MIPGWGRTGRQDGHEGFTGPSIQCEVEVPANETFGISREFTQREESSWLAAKESLREAAHELSGPASANQRQKEMSFLRHLMLYDNSDEGRKMDEQIRRTEGNERCVRRAMFVMAILAGLALTGLGYSVVLLDDFFQNRFQLAIRLFCALGLASGLSLTAFLVIWFTSRAELDEQREQCRRLVTRIVEARLGKAHDGLSQPGRVLPAAIRKDSTP